MLLTRRYVITNVKYTKQKTLFMSILINTKREYIVIPIIPYHIGAYFYIYSKITYLSFYWQKYNRKNFKLKKESKKEKYEMKWKIKNSNVKNMKYEI